MMGLSESDILEAWGRCATLSPTRQGLVLLAMARPEWTAEECASASIGRRDAALLRLRKQTFGEQLEVHVECPRCEEPLEFAVRVDDLITRPGEQGECRWQEGPWWARIRAPNSQDLLAIEHIADPNAASRTLLARCVLELQREGEPVAAEAIPPELFESLSARMGELDPQAELSFNLSCPSCQHGWTSVFNVVDFLRDELKAAARQLAHEVHVLAGAYGWSEGQILALQPARRHLYIALLGGA